MLEEAKRLHNLGFKIIPTGSDKRPLCKWKAYQESQSLEDGPEAIYLGPGPLSPGRKVRRGGPNSPGPGSGAGSHGHESNPGNPGRGLG